MNEILALVLTDVVESTALNQELGDAEMASLWRAHDMAARDLMAAWRGEELARSDGFLVLFRTPEEAVEWCVAYHGFLRSLPHLFQARAGIHVGPVTRRPNSESDRLRGAPPYEVDGLALPLAARVMGAARGGQTLISADAAAVLGTTRHRLVTHGFWRLKGIAEPVELLQVGDRSSSYEPPSDSVKAYRVIRSAAEWVPVRNIPNNLPAERDSFVGRSEDLAAFADRLDRRLRLVTVLGIGGIGKTRLVLRYARTWLGDYPGGAYFADLSTSRNVDGIVHAVGLALNVPLSGSDPVQQLGAAIAARGACLIILDNFEQVASFAEETLGTWLQVSAEALFVVTSREVLGLRGEHAMVLPSLSPREGAELFASRSKSTDLAFDLSEEDRQAISPLMKLLDGLPLAIELAAARSSVMGPGTLLRRMSDRFAVLGARGSRGGRQATLRTALDWSWDLLSDPERRALAQLSVFRGGFRLEAVEAVVERPASAFAASIVDLLQSLVDKSLVRRISNHRFDLLVSVQEYAAEQLRNIDGASGADGTLVAELRHCAYYVDARSHDQALLPMVELDNLLIGCRRAAARGDASQATLALELAWVAISQRGPMNTALELAAAIRSSGIADVRDAARIGRIVGSALRSLGRIVESRSELRNALLGAADVEDLALQGQILCLLGDHDVDAGQMQDAFANLTLALDIARELRDPSLECMVLNSLGSRSEALGDIDEALTHYDQALTIATKAGDRRWEGGTLGNLANVRTLQGRFKDAEPLHEKALAIARELGDRRWEGNTLCNLGLTSQALGRLAKAAEDLDAALVIAKDLGQRRLQSVTLCNLAIVAEAMGSIDMAQDHFKQSIAVAHELGDRRSEGQFLTYLGLLAAKTGRAPEARQHLHRAEVLLEAVSDVFSLGFAVAARAEIEARSGAAEEAIAFLKYAESLAAAVLPGEDSEFGAALSRARQFLSSGLIQEPASPPRGSK